MALKENKANKEDTECPMELCQLTKKGNSLKYKKEEIILEYYFENIIMLRSKRDTLKLIKQGTNTDEAFRKVGFNNKIHTGDLKNTLIKEEYIKENNNDLQTYLDTLNQKQLKKVLKKNKLKKQGKPEELKQRIQENLSSEDLGIEKTYILLDKGENLLENKTLNEFLLFLPNFYYNEFEEFQKNKDDELFTQFLEFLDKHFKIAMDRKDHIAHIDISISSALIYLSQKNYIKSLEWMLTKFIIELNPVLLDKKHYTDYEILDNLSLHIIKELNKKFTTEQIKETHDKIFDDVPVELLAPKQETWKIINEIIQTKSIKHTNKKINQFKTEYWK